MLDLSPDRQAAFDAAADAAIARDEAGTPRPHDHLGFLLTLVADGLAAIDAADDDAALDRAINYVRYDLDTIRVLAADHTDAIEIIRLVDDLRAALPAMKDTAAELWATACKRYARWLWTAPPLADDGHDDTGSNPLRDVAEHRCIIQVASPIKT